MTYEQAKQMVARAEELAQAVNEGKRVEWLRGGQTRTESVNVKASEFFASMMHDYPAEYRIVDPLREEAERLAQAIKEGKRVEYRDGKGEWVKSNCEVAEEFMFGETHTSIRERYRIVEPPKSRPWTPEETRRHVGWVLVSPDGRRGLITSNEGELVGQSGPHANPTLTMLYNEGWHVCLPGTPDDLKPCWTEVDE